MNSIPCPDHMQIMKHASEGIQPGFETHADVTRSSKQRYQWPHGKGH